MMADQIHADFTTPAYDLTIETQFLGADAKLPTKDDMCLYWQQSTCRNPGNKCPFKVKVSGKGRCTLYEGRDAI